MEFFWLVKWRSYGPIVCKLQLSLSHYHHTTTASIIIWCSSFTSSCGGLCHNKISHESNVTQFAISCFYFCVMIHEVASHVWSRYVNWLGKTYTVHVAIIVQMEWKHIAYCCFLLYFSSSVHLRNTLIMIILARSYNLTALSIAWMCEPQKSLPYKQFDRTETLLIIIRQMHSVPPTYSPLWNRGFQ